MRQEYEPDFTTTLTIAASTTDAYVAIPSNVPDSMLSNPRDSGSLYYINVDGAPVAINLTTVANQVTHPAVWPTTTGANNSVMEAGNNMTHPVWLPPGWVLHAICKTGTAIVSLIRARRAS
jgi:hypothetical protein